MDGFLALPVSFHDKNVALENGEKSFRSPRLGTGGRRVADVKDWTEPIHNFFAFKGDRRRGMDRLI